MPGEPRLLGFVSSSSVSEDPGTVVLETGGGWKSTGFDVPGTLECLSIGGTLKRSGSRMGGAVATL